MMRLELECKTCGAKGMHDNGEFGFIRPPLSCMSTVLWYHRPCSEEGEEGGGLCEEFPVEDLRESEPREEMEIRDSFQKRADFLTRHSQGDGPSGESRHDD